MREIKFRGKTKEGKWVCGYLAESCYGTVILPKDGDPALYHVDGCEWNVREYEVIPETVGQFTGMKDKNGKDIYERDILESKSWANGARQKNPYNVVEWKGIKWVAIGYNGDMRVSPDLNIKSDLEVIGNIHDNPELLTGGKS